jgi:heptosyltransferase-2
MSDNTLIIGPSWIGDMVMAQCLFQRIKQNFPPTKIDVFAPKWTGALVECMPECDKLIPSDLKHGQLGLKSRYNMAKSLQGNYTRAYILPNSFKSALIPFWAKVPERIAWRGEWRDILLTQTVKEKLDEYPLMVQRYVALIDKNSNRYTQDFFRPKFKISKDIKQLACSKFDIDISKSILGICPGAAYGPSKQWIAKRFVEVANHYSSIGWNVCIFGSINDALISEYIVEKTPHNCYNFSGKTNLTEAIALLEQCSLVLSHDSGLMHVAAALQRPLIVLYGSSSPKFTPPLSERVSILQHNVGCNPCFKRKCYKTEHLCMQAITTKEVLESGDKVCSQ